MKLTQFVVSWERSIRIILVLSLVLLVQTAAIGLLGVKLYLHRERVVVVPPLAVESGGRLEVAWRDANREYTKSIALYITTLIGNITPDNVQFVADSLSRYFSPEIYGTLRTKILSLAKDDVWAGSSQASYFAPRQILYEEGTARVFVMGDIVITGHAKLSERKPVVYELIVSIKNGLPLVEHFTSYEGTQPHTVKWLLNQPEDVRLKNQWLIDRAQGKGPSRVN